MAMIQALGNVSKVRGALVFVEDIEAEMRFYRDVIGMRLLYRTPKFVRFDATQGTSLSLIAGGFASAEPKDFRHGGVVPEIIVDNLRLALLRHRGRGRPPRGTSSARTGASSASCGIPRATRSSSTSRRSSGPTSTPSGCPGEFAPELRPPHRGGTHRGPRRPRSRSSRSAAIPPGRHRRPARRAGPRRQRHRRRAVASSPGPSGAAAPSPLVAIDPSLLDLLPKSIGSIPIIPSPEAAAEPAADASLADVGAVARRGPRRRPGDRQPRRRLGREAQAGRLQRRVLPRLARLVRRGRLRPGRRRGRQRPGDDRTAGPSSSGRARAASTPITSTSRAPM